MRVGEGPEEAPASGWRRAFWNDAKEDWSMEERTREVLVGPAFVPGDLIGIEMGSLHHRPGLTEVLAIFEMDDVRDEGSAPRDIILRGRLLPTPLPHLYPSGDVGGEDLVSRVTLSAVVPPGALPGEYRCQRLEAETRTGRRVPFAPVSEAAWQGWRFRVR